MYWYDSGAPLFGLPEGSTPITLEEAKEINGGAFHGEQPYPSWTLHESESYWLAPIPAPADGNMYDWDEATLSWIEVTL